jgi:transposase IS4-like protein
LCVQSAIGFAVATITKTITVAAGVFAPGHLGELTQIVPFELADGVVADARVGQRRLRRLPSRVGIYFVLALGLFPRAGYLGVWAKLTAALDGLGLAGQREGETADGVVGVHCDLLWRGVGTDGL